MPSPGPLPGWPTPATAPDLTHHGDRDLSDGLLDLAVNVRAPAPARWLADQIARPQDWASYPSSALARTAIAARHGVDEAMVLPTAGAAEAFTLVARGLASRCSVVVHPQFTEPEHSLRLAGHLPRRALLRAPDFLLDPALVDPRADLVVVGNPTNPTGVLHPASVLETLRRPGRVLLVDEAFMDAVPQEPETMIGPEMPGLLVTRSLTKTWSLAGIRAGYVVGDMDLIARLERQQTPWSVSTPAAAAMVACSTEPALAEAAREAAVIEQHRAVLEAGLQAIGMPPVPGSRAPFVLVESPQPLREALLTKGFAVRRGESFPGLAPNWTRLAVRDPGTTRQLLDALQDLPHLTNANPQAEGRR